MVRYFGALFQSIFEREMVRYFGALFQSISENYSPNSILEGWVRDFQFILEMKTVGHFRALYQY